MIQVVLFFSVSIFNNEWNNMMMFVNTLLFILIYITYAMVRLKKEVANGNLLDCRQTRKIHFVYSLFSFKIEVSI